MKVIAVANQKGGVGKTTTSLNLSTCLAELGQRILLIDLDPQANATSGLGIEPMDDISASTPMMGTATLTEMIIPTRFPNLWLIPANIDLAGVEVEAIRSGDHLMRLHDALAAMRTEAPFDFIVLDCPPSLGVLMTNALCAADEILIPLQCEYYSLEGLAKMVGLCERLRESGANSGLQLCGILMTMYMRTNHSNAVIAEIQKHYGDIIFKTVIPRTIRLAEAPSHGQPIIQYEPGGLGSAAYRGLAKEFLSREGVNAVTTAD